MTSIHPTISVSELWTILAALEWFKQCGFGSAELRPRNLHDIATNGGEVPALNEEKIKLLLERLDGADSITIDHGART